ncbi:uncharacterized protein LOC112573870 isoform X2 [Pomacea canaliculata]|uniref:uncharacterized protein LOC112573870 isoform X2 n=1 Tax=Pomacea canaliculata TaxID=400727 RepID=UPI000D736492|nr:uncharacterized protein LOC112573870 isoform X2 [Pomacea canaliculata]
MATRTMRLRPVLEHRMPTLVSKAAFSLPADSAKAKALGRNKVEGHLQPAAPPRNLQEVRAAVSKSIASVTRKLARLERDYYGDKRTVHSDAEQYVPSVKALMRALWILDLNKASEVEELIKQSVNPQRYKDDAKHPAALKEIYARVMTFLPDRLTPLIDACQGLLDNLSRYCVSFYSAESDSYLETAAHYTEQITSWREKVEVSLLSARSLYKKFQTTGINHNMLSSPVANFCSRCDINKLLFIVMFADASTHLRNALTVMKSWLQTDENYTTYVKNDMIELEKLKEDKIKVLRDLRTKCHSLTYKVNQLESEERRLAQEITAMREKEESLRIEEVFLVNQINEVDLEIEFKERRRDNLRKQSAVEPLEPTTETPEALVSELKQLKDRLPTLQRQLAHLRHKLGWVDDKMAQLEKTQKDILATREELKEADSERGRKEEEFEELDQALLLARRILLVKNATDSVEKLYYNVPVDTKASKTSKVKTKVKDPVENACRIICSHIDRDWVQLYRNLTFFPQRGAETIERDLLHLTEMGARASVALASRHALERWKRYHTRANVEDLRQALMKIKRTDILRLIDDRLKMPTKVVDPFELQEELPPPVEPKLVPYYRLIERYDQLRASRVK